MIYVHGLRQLNPKSADIEATYLLRELKRKTPPPFNVERQQAYFQEFFVSNTDREAITTALQTLPGLVEELRQLHQEGDRHYELINVERALNMLETMPTPLAGNLQFIQDVESWQEGFVPEVTALLNKMPQIRSLEERKTCDAWLDAMFTRLLRNNSLRFNAVGIVDEEHITTMGALAESMRKGFFFHVTVEEELKKAGFGDILPRIPPEKLARAQAIQAQMDLVKRGVDRAYEVNLRLVEWSLVLYAYLKWLYIR